MIPLADYLHQRYTQQSVQRYLGAIQRFCQSFQPEETQQLSLYTIVNYIGSQRAQGYSSGHLETGTPRH